MDALTLFGLVAVTAMLVFPQPPVHPRLCHRLRACFALWVLARRLALRRRRGDLGRGRRLAVAGADARMKPAPLTAWQRQLLHCDRLLAQDWHRVAPGEPWKAAKNLTPESLKGAG